jgi:hypothetical protein
MTFSSSQMPWAPIPEGTLFENHWKLKIGNWKFKIFKEPLTEYLRAIFMDLLKNSIDMKTKAGRMLLVGWL